MKRRKFLQTSLAVGGAAAVPAGLTPVMAGTGACGGTEAVLGAFAAAGASILDSRRMTLEEIFVANVMHSRRERGHG